MLVSLKKITSIRSFAQRSCQKKFSTFHPCKIHSLKTFPNFVLSQKSSLQRSGGLQNFRRNQNFGGVPKRGFSTKTFKFESGVCAIPHEGKMNPLGEDAYFINNFAVGVADGVGGWAEMGIDPSIFSNKLMKTCDIESKRDQPIGNVLKNSHKSCLGIQGSCTAALALLRDGMLELLNYGDSGIAIVRDNSTLLRTVEQQYSFNFPLQLGHEDHERTATSSASVVKFRPKLNDLVILASDGLWDNLFDHEIEELIQIEMTKTPPANSQTLAKVIGNQAFKRSRSKNETPFARYSGGRFSGGKPDDITVLVAKIISNENDQK